MAQKVEADLPLQVIRLVAPFQQLIQKGSFPLRLRLPIHFCVSHNSLYLSGYASHTSFTDRPSPPRPRRGPLRPRRNSNPSATTSKPCPITGCASGPSWPSSPARIWPTPRADRKISLPSPVGSPSVSAACWASAKKPGAENIPPPASPPSAVSTPWCPPRKSNAPCSPSDARCAAPCRLARRSMPRWPSQRGVGAWPLCATGQQSVYAMAQSPKETAPQNHHRLCRPHGRQTRPPRPPHRHHAPPKPPLPFVNTPGVFGLFSSYPFTRLFPSPKLPECFKRRIRKSWAKNSSRSAARGNII